MRTTTYFQGDLAEYTGESEIVFNCRLFKIKVLEGHLEGQIKETYKCPDCGLTLGQDQSAFNPCLTCQVI